MEQFKYRKKAIFLLLSIISLCTLVNAGATVKVPGEIQAFNQYLNSYYCDEGNFIYHFNEILLFEKIPTYSEIHARVVRNITTASRINLKKKYVEREYRLARMVTLQERLKAIFAAHRRLKSYMNRVSPEGSVSLDLDTASGFKLAKRILARTGLALEKVSGAAKNYRYRIFDRNNEDSSFINHYYRATGLNPWKMENALGKSNRFDFKVREFNARLPRDLDFLARVTGLELTPDSFMSNLVRNKRLQLFIAALSRMSDREVAFISGLGQQEDAWRRIYRSDRFLAGMFVLSHALRVNSNRLILPGGLRALPFWESLAGVPFNQNPMVFLENLATKDHGKLNLLFTFSFFLPPETQKILLADFDAEKLAPLYTRMSLNKDEKLNGLAIPKLRDFGFFTLMFALKPETPGQAIHFPGGLDTWVKVTGAKENSVLGLLAHLLEDPDRLQRFIPVYAKFHDRGGLLNEDALRALYDNYDKYNVLVDFIEKIPVKKPSTVLALLDWAKGLSASGLPRNEKDAVVAIGQSLLELVANRAKFMPKEYDYDRLMEAFVRLPHNGEGMYDGFFDFLENQLLIEMDPSVADKWFFEFLIPGGGRSDRNVTVHGLDYTLEPGPVIKDEIVRTLEAQAVCAISDLSRINLRLEGIRRRSFAPGKDLDYAAKKLLGAVARLPLQEVEENVPSYLKHLVMTYSGDRFLKTVNNLIARKGSGASQTEVDALVNKIKRTGLLQELKNFLVACLYANAVKNGNIQPFLNPNLTRLHDFTPPGKATAWNNSQIKKVFFEAAIYHLEGGLSRLNAVLATPLSMKMLNSQMESPSSQSSAICFNTLDFLPHPGVNRARDFTALLVEFGRELLKKSVGHPQVREAVMTQIFRITAGYRYRGLMTLLTGSTGGQKTKTNFRLYFSDLLKLGEYFFHRDLFMDQFSMQKQLEAFRKPGVYREVLAEMEHMGTIYYRTFGTLNAHRFNIFPQALSHLFKSHWVGAEMIDEFKVKAACISYSRQLPPQILGFVMHRYFRLLPNVFFQNYENDYYKTLYLYDIFSYLYFNQVYDELRKVGILRIKP